MQLTKLGWNADLNQHFAPYHAKGLVPARVAVEDKLFFRIWTADVELLVETPMASGGSGADSSFNRLFRFITGGNEAKQKIAMTTPVFKSGSGSNEAMAFVMPAKLKAGDVPKPADEQIRVRELEAGRFAVLRYSGGRNADNEAQCLERLCAWMKAEGLKELSPPIYGYFDPPWTPGFLRRNEVMLRTGSDR